MKWLLHLAKDIKVNPIIKADAVEAVLLGVLFEFSVANLPRIPKLSYKLYQKKNKRFCNRWGYYRDSNKNYACTKTYLL